MLEFIKDIATDFVLFSGIEGLIFCLFFIKVGGCKKINFLQWFILSFVNCLISKILPPVIYQLVIILWISVFLYLNKLKDTDNYFVYLKISAFSVSMFLITETLYSILLKYLSNFEALRLFISTEELFKLFLMIIPLRIIEIINIFIIKEIIKMKIIIGGVVRK